MSTREVIAYAITHAPKGVKGGPYEGGSVYGTPVTFPVAERWAVPPLNTLARVRAVVPTARVIRIVRARSSHSEDATKAERRANTERLRVIAKNLCGLLMDIEVASREDIGAGVALQIMEINRLLPVDDRVSVPEVGEMPSEAMPVVRAAMAWSAVYAAHGDPPDMDLNDAVEAYRKAGGTT